MANSQEELRQAFEVRQQLESEQIEARKAKMLEEPDRYLRAIDGVGGNLDEAARLDAFERLIQSLAEDPSQRTIYGAADTAVAAVIDDERQQAADEFARWQGVQAQRALRDAQQQDPHYFSPEMRAASEERSNYEPLRQFFEAAPTEVGARHKDDREVADLSLAEGMMREFMSGEASATFHDRNDEAQTVEPSRVQAGLEPQDRGKDDLTGDMVEDFVTAQDRKKVDEQLELAIDREQEQFNLPFG